LQRSDILPSVLLPEIKEVKRGKHGLDKELKRGYKTSKEVKRGLEEVKIG